ncbi:unnamed protein product [Arabidopsis halleri]
MGTFLLYQIVLRSISFNGFLFIFMVMVAILFVGDVVFMEHLSHSSAVISTSKPMIQCDAVLFSQIYKYKWRCRDLVSSQLVQPDLLWRKSPWKPPWKKRQFGDDWIVTISNDLWRIIRRWFIPYKQQWVLSTTKTNDISFYMRVSINTKALRCNRWIAAYDFRMHYRYFISKKKMIPKQESHTGLTKMTKMIKNLTKKAARNLLHRFFVTQTIGCICNLVDNHVYSDSY